MKITLSRNEILASLLFCSRDKTRPSINGMLIEINPGKSPLLVSSDGLRLAVIKSQSALDYSETEPAEIIFSASFLRIACELSKRLGGKKYQSITLEYDLEKDGIAKATLFGHGLQIRELTGVISGQFPNWREVVPPKRKTKVAPHEFAFRVKYVMDFQSAADLLGDDNGLRFQISEDGAGPFEIKLGQFNEFYGLLMPTGFKNPLDSYRDIFLNDYLESPVK